MRRKIIDYIKKKYKAEPEHLWRSYPDYIVFRHSDNNKWFGIIMDVSRDKLGLDGDDRVDIIDVKVGDTVFMYVASPVSAILYKCKVTETDIPYKYADENLTISALMKIKLLKRYKPEKFTIDVLKEEYGLYAIRGPRGISNSLSAALK